MNNGTLAAQGESFGTLDLLNSTAPVKAFDPIVVPALRELIDTFRLAMKSAIFTASAKQAQIQEMVHERTSIQSVLAQRIELNPAYDGVEERRDIDRLNADIATAIKEGKRLAAIANRLRNLFDAISELVARAKRERIAFSQRKTTLSKGATSESVSTDDAAHARDYESVGKCPPPIAEEESEIDAMVDARAVPPRLGRTARGKFVMRPERVFAGLDGSVADAMSLACFIAPEKVKAALKQQLRDKRKAEGVPSMPAAERKKRLSDIRARRDDLAYMAAALAWKEHREGKPLVFPDNVQAHHVLGVHPIP